MIVDFHTHIFPDHVRRNRASYFSEEPDFKLLYAPPTSRLAGVDALLSEMDACGVDRSVVFGFPWKNIDTVRMHNDYVLDAVSRYPERLVGLCCVDPAHPESVAEARRCIGMGLSGLGELASYSGDFDKNLLERLDPLMALCRQADLPVLIHANEPFGHDYPGKSPMTLAGLFRLIMAFPLNKIVLAHFGGGLCFYHLLKRGVKPFFEHLYFDTAAAPFLYSPDIYRIAGEIVGFEKILLGSDFPLLPPKRYFSDLDKAGVSEPDMRRITGGNAATLLKLF